MIVQRRDQVGINLQHRFAARQDAQTAFTTASPFARNRICQVGGRAVSAATHPIDPHKISIAKRANRLGPILFPA
ncbi:hypothetical protein BIWAKO_01733 [Bosea sp. BIWAKO-01]|nr:hypothetical protein BIWAKO_01733 [Bosea sp. BIWAKO-01]